MKVIAVMQARMGASRLPGKIVAPLLGQPILSVIVRRLSLMRVESAWIATSDSAQDQVTVAWGRDLGWNVYRGDEANVLSRFTGVLRECKADWVIRLTADNPFVDSGIVNCLIDTAERAPAGVNLVRFAGDARFPLGYVPEIARAESLLRAESEIPPGQDFHRSHVTSWVAQTSGVYPVEYPLSWPARPNWRWTVDTECDYHMATKAFELWRGNWAGIGYPEMVELLDAHPEISDINVHVNQKNLNES